MGYGVFYLLLRDWGVNNHMFTTRHLPDHTDFAHLARVPWPLEDPDQIDWIGAYTTVESWLNTSIGPHWVRWAWSTCQDQTTFDCCVRFRYSADRTLFLLRWAV